MRLPALLAALALSSLPALAQPRPAAPGESVTKWPNGQPRAVTVRFQDGTKRVTHYREDGTREYEASYDERGRQHGDSTRWLRGGGLFVIEHHEHGKKVGEWTYYGDDGKPVSRFVYEDDREVRHLTWSARFGWQEFK